MESNERTPLLVTEPRPSGGGLLRKQDTTSDGDHTSELCRVYRSSLGSSESSGSEENGQGEHCHRNSNFSSRMDTVARRKLLIASGLCLAFMIAEVVGGVLANSLAIATDAAHLMTDFASFMISLFSLVMAARPATKRMSFGWYRAEVMGALLSVLLIWVVTGILFYMAVQRVISGDYEIDAKVMIITAGVGVAFNIVMGVTLHDSTHTHSHGGHSHGHSHHGHSNKPLVNSDTESHHSSTAHPTVTYSSSHARDSSHGSSNNMPIRYPNKSNEQGQAPEVNHSGNNLRIPASTRYQSDSNDEVFIDAASENSPPLGNRLPSERNDANQNVSRAMDQQMNSSVESVALVVENEVGRMPSVTDSQCGRLPADKVPTSDKTGANNINVRAAFIHVAGDMVQSLGVLIAAYIIYYKPEWKLADPICTFIFSFLVLFTTITILRDILIVLMEGTPRGISFNEVKECLCSIEGVRELHNLRLWSLTVNKTAMSVHLALDSTANAQQVLSVAGRMMHDKFGVYECTVQIENYVNEMNDCVQCQDPSD